LRSDAARSTDEQEWSKGIDMRRNLLVRLEGSPEEERLGGMLSPVELGRALLASVGRGQAVRFFEN
jgi:hypothetical protein